MASSDRDPKVIGSVSFQVPGNYRYLNLVREKVLEQARQVGLPDDKTAQLEMAVDEAVTNIIEHSYAGRGKGAAKGDRAGLKLNFLQFIDRIVVEIVDHGTGFDFSGHKVVEPDQYVDTGRSRGLGMYIITRFVDKVSYKRGTPDGNVLRLTKMLK